MPPPVDDQHASPPPPISVQRYFEVSLLLMMLAAAILTVSTNYLAGLALYVLLSTSTFLSYEVKRSGEAARVSSATRRDAALRLIIFGETW